MAGKWKVTKAELVEKNSLLTLELNRLEKQMQDLCDIFNELGSRYAEVQNSCCPCKYGPVTCMIRDATARAAQINDASYGAIHRQTSPQSGHGIVPRLLENVQNFVPNMKAVSDLVAIRNQLTLMKKKEVKRDLKEKETALSQQKVLLEQMQDLLRELEQLDTDFQHNWFLMSYSLRVESMLFAFRQISSRTSSRMLPSSP